MTGSSNASTYQQLLPQFYIVLILLLFHSKYLVQEKKIEIYIIIVVFAKLMYMLIGGNTGMLSSIPNGLLLPAMISALITCNNKVIIKPLNRIIILFFITNCTISIIEKISNINIFPFTLSNEELRDQFYAFRSTALQNHPLNNALIVSTIMSFIIVNTKINKNYKVFYLCLGFISLLCFNTRSSILLWSIIIIFLVIKEIANKRNKLLNKVLLLLGFIVSTSILYYLLFFAGWGDRLIDKGLSNDHSINTRLEAWNIFNLYNMGDFLWGLSGKEYNSILRKVGLLHLENFWLIFIIRYGLIFTLILTYLYSILISRIFSSYPKYSKYFIIGCFLILSSSNNSLAFSEQPLTILLLIGYANNTYRKINVKRSTLTNEGIIHNTYI